MCSKGCSATRAGLDDAKITGVLAGPVYGPAFGRVVVLAGAVVISAFKPWGKTPAVGAPQRGCEPIAVRHDPASERSARDRLALTSFMRRYKRRGCSGTAMNPCRW